MTQPELDDLLRRFRRRMACSTAVRWLIVFSVAASFATAGPFGGAESSWWITVWLTAVLLGWLMLVAVSVRTGKGMRWASVLLTAGRWQEAERELAHVLRSFSVFRHTLLAAGQQLGTVLHAQQQYAQAREVFRAIVRAIGRTRASHSVERAARLLWADCELALGNLAGTYEAFLPLYGVPLTLSERLVLLPIELRYELAAGHTRHAVANLPDRVRHAELLDSVQSAWVHAMLAEACRREGLDGQAAFLQRRAALYHDLNELPPLVGVGVADPGPAAPAVGGTTGEPA